MTLGAAGLSAWLRAFAGAVGAEKDALTALDAAIGDADHGANMERGMAAVVAKLPGLEGGGAGALLQAVGMTLVSTVGGASGALYGTLFLQMGAAAAGQAELSPAAFAGALARGVAGLTARGKAQPGDKTMVDALGPAVAALQAGLTQGCDLAAALGSAACAARAGAEATTPLVARKGRASYLGERSAGHQDPGATSAALLMEAAARTLGGAAGAPDVEGLGSAAERAPAAGALCGAPARVPAAGAPGDEAADEGVAGAGAAGAHGKAGSG